MAPLVPDGPQDVAPEEDEIRAMEQDAPVLEVAPRTCSNQGRARKSRASHGASTSIGPTTQEMDPMTIVLQRLDSQDIQLHEI
uniref:Uncharacterized protein n=1 Tax=Vitis vinifera TaxID=29760 RepID=A5B7J3_VITVI|nr:hypothetical protein VITISV_034655 [Vitis vinifera]